MRERLRLLSALVFVIALTLRQSLMSFGAQIVTNIVIYGSYAYIAYQTLQGSVTLGSLVMYYQALQRGQSALNQFLGGIAGLHGHMVGIGDYGADDFCTFGFQCGQMLSNGSKNNISTWSPILSLVT